MTRYLRIVLFAAMLALPNAAPAASFKQQSEKTPVVTLPPVPQTAAPEYAISGRVDDLSQTILAEIPGLGPISSLDMLMFNTDNRPQLSSIPLDIWIEPDSIAAEAYQPVIRAEIQRLAALVSLAGRSADWTPGDDMLRRLGFDGAIIGYARNVVANQVKVEEPDIHLYYIAHPEKYIQRRRVDARYIFMRVAANADTPARLAARQQLDDVARRVNAREIGFDEAARRYSQAPSAASGGRIPAFLDGRYFPDFEKNLLACDPGRMTPVFEGPGGFYLAQLISATPPQNIPLAEVRDDIRRILTREHLKFYYRTALGELQKRYRYMNYATGLNYEYMNLNAPLARVGKVALTRPEFLRIYASPVQPDYSVNESLVQRNVAHWIEGETIQEEMEQLGRGSDRYIMRARELGTIPFRARQTMIHDIDPAKYSATEAATNTLTTVSMGELRSVLVAQIQLMPNPKIKTDAEKLAAGRQIGELNSVLDSGVLKVDPEPLNIAEWVRQSDFSTTVTTAAAIASLQGKIANSPYPNITMQAMLIGWADAVPNSQWDHMLGGLAPGRVSQAIVTPAMTTRYIVLAERPINVNNWKTQPRILRLMAWRVLTDRAIAAEGERLRRESAIKYNF